MTVGELKNKLKDFSDDLPVVVKLSISYPDGSISEYLWLEACDCRSDKTEFRNSNDQVDIKDVVKIDYD